MEFVNVINSKKFDLESYGQIINRFLISLINGLKNTSFGLDTIEKEAVNLCEIYERLKRIDNNKKLYIDSGGYSIIVGDVHPRDIKKFINCYTHYLEKYYEYYDYIFSLDIPIFLKFPNYNRKDYIYNMNDLSVKYSSQIVKKDNLWNKFIYVWHFKLFEQYNIWNDIYKKYFNNHDCIHHGLGGMVGLRGITNIDFSPFIGMTFKIAKLMKDSDHLMNEYENKERILHYLGVYHLHDRFIGKIYEQLINKYYFIKNDCQSRIKITYDTINYFLTGQYKCRELNIFDGEKEINIIDSEELIKSEFTDNIQKVLLESISALKNNKNIPDMSLIPILNIYSQLKIDRLFENIINEYNITDMFYDKANFYKLRNQLNPILYKLNKQYPYIFTTQRINGILSNFQITYSFWDWLILDGRQETFNLKFEKFTNLINFPFKLS